MLTDGEIRDRFRAANDWCVKFGAFRGGWPDFEQAAYDVPNRIVYGHVLMTSSIISWDDVPASEYRATDLRTMFVGAHDYARRNGFSHGFPNFHEANSDSGTVFGTFLIRKNVCEPRDILARDLGLGEGDPTLRSLDEWFRGAARYVANDNNYVAALPNGNYLKYPDGWHCGVMFVPHGSATRLDIRGRELRLPDRADPPTGVVATGSALRASQILGPDNSLLSPNGRFRLTLQRDGNFVLYQTLNNGSVRSMWASDTPGRQVSVCILQGNGDIVLYDKEASPVWNSRTAGNENAYLQVQDDGNLVLYRADGSPLWSTDTPRISIKKELERIDGFVEVVLRPDGGLRFAGHVHNGGLESFAYRVSIIVENASKRIRLALTRTGDVGGWQILSNDSHDEWWAEDSTNPAVALYWDEFAAGCEMTVVEEKQGSISDFVSDAVEFLLKFGVGTLAVGTGMGVIILAGVELFSLASSGSLVPGARIIGGVLWLAGPYGALMALGAEGIVSIGSKSRELSEDEYGFARGVFGETLPNRSEILITDSLGADSRPFVFPRFDGKITMNLGPLYADPLKDKSLFVHELAHVWQVHHSGNILWIASGLVAQICNSFGGGTYTLEAPGRPFGDFNLEQQANIIMTWYKTNEDDRAASVWYPYVRDNFRQGAL